MPNDFVEEVKLLAEKSNLKASIEEKQFIALIKLKIEHIFGKKSKLFLEEIDRLTIAEHPYYVKTGGSGNGCTIGYFTHPSIIGQLFNNATPSFKTIMGLYYSVLMKIFAESGLLDDCTGPHSTELIVTYDTHSIKTGYILKQILIAMLFSKLNLNTEIKTRGVSLLDLNIEMEVVTSLGEYIIEDFLDDYDSDLFLIYLIENWEKYIEEINQLENEIISGKISFLDVLNNFNLALSLPNYQFSEINNSKSRAHFSNQYPTIYRSYIDFKLSEIAETREKRSILFDAARNTIFFHNKNRVLNVNCWDKILNYLNNEDIENVAKASSIKPMLSS